MEEVFELVVEAEPEGLVKLMLAILETNASLMFSRKRYRGNYLCVISIMPDRVERFEKISQRPIRRRESPSLTERVIIKREKPW